MRFLRISRSQSRDSLKDLEPMAAATPSTPAASTRRAKGLEWYLKRKGLQSAYQSAAALRPLPVSPPSNKPELLGYGRTPSYLRNSDDSEGKFRERIEEPAVQHEAEQKQEAALFSYIAGESGEAPAPSSSRFRIGKGAIIAASMLAAIAVVAAPQAPWHPGLKIVVAKAQHSLHIWLNPQPVTAVSQAPASHEDFGRAGDEYKLPVAETIPDATTDPSQIQVVPAVDPTAKKPATDAANPDQSQSPVDANPTPVPEASQTPAVQVPENPPVAQPAPTAASPATMSTPTSAPPPATAIPTVASPSNPSHSESPTVLTTPAPSSSVPYPPATAPTEPIRSADNQGAIESAVPDGDYGARCQWQQACRCCDARNRTR